MRWWRIAALATAASLSLSSCSESGPPPQQEAAELDPHALSSQPTSVEARRSALDSLVAEAEEIYWRGDHKAAADVFSEALEHARSLHDTAAEASILTGLGNTAYRLGEYREWRRLGEQALELKLQAGLKDQLFKSYNSLGLLAWYESRLSDAVELYTKAAEAAAAVGDLKGLASVAGNLALVQLDLGRFSEARRGFIEMRVRGRDLGDARIEGNALNNLGALYVAVGDPRSAIESLNEAGPLYASIGYITGEQNRLGQLASAFEALGEPGEAFAALDSALAMSRQQGLRQEQASNLELLAEFHRDAGNFGRALQLYAEAKEINAELGLQLETGVDLLSEAQIFVSLGDLELAADYAEQALEIHRAVGAPFEEFGDLIVLADLAQRAGRSTDVAAYIRSARSLARQLDVRLVRVEAALAEARIAERGADARQVVRVLDHARDDLARGGYGSEWEANALRARAYAELGMLDSAVVAGRRAVAAVERVRGKYGSGVLRTSFVTDRARAYSDLVLVLLRLGRVEEAFEVADAARGRALREHLAAARRDVVGSPGAAGALAEGEELLRRIDELVARLDEIDEFPPDERGPEIEAEAELLYRQLEEARAEYEALLVRVGERDPAAAALIGGAAVRASAVRDALRPGEALLEYLITPDRLILFVVTPEGIRSVGSDISASRLSSRLRVARGLVADAGGRAEPSPPVLSRLHQTLIGPALRSAALDGVSRLIIVPHGELTYLPFAALRDEITGSYLVEDFSLLQLPTSAALTVLRESRRARESGRDAATVAFAPFPDRFPATRAEARAVSRTASGAKARIGKRAREADVREALSSGAIVHVASHAVMNARNPMFSRVELARGSGAQSADDGRLEVHELLGLSVTSPLVFLSGCETGLGTAWSTEFARGDDYATLAQAFLYAGAGNVIATLWRVEDAGAALFAERFYRHLRSVPPADALARAQRDMMSDSQYSAAYYWAAYVLSGTGDLGPAQNPAAASVQQRQGKPWIPTRSLP